MKGDKMTGVSCADNCDLYDKGYTDGEKTAEIVLFHAFRPFCKYWVDVCCEHKGNKKERCEQDACPIFHKGVVKC